LWIIFQPNASAYQISVEPDQYLDIGGATGVGEGGVSNESGVVQNFVSRADSDGGGSQITIKGTAGSLSTFTTEPQGVVDGGSGNVWIYYHGSAGSAAFVNEGGIVSGGNGGAMTFYDAGKGGTATMVNKAAVVSGAGGGLTMLWTNSSAQNSRITCEGAPVSGAGGGITRFVDTSVAAQATLIAEGGSNGGGGGTIQFQTKSDGLGSRIEVFGNGSLDLSALGTNTLSIGSLEGDGLVLLGSHRLSIGDSNLSTTFSGVIQDSGSLLKLGAGTLTLSGANTYTGSTIVTAGALIIDNKTGFATGTGTVNINAGTLGGSGRIFGAVTIGTGSGTGAFLEPSFGSNKVSLLRIGYPLSFKGDGTYVYKVSTRSAKGDEVRANDVTIESGAQFDFQPIGNKKLASGTVFTAISNISFDPISGSFANLVDGSTFTAGRNTFQASYEGGDGNDLTLTVVP
jgi:autotransporter-associated beta strand protein